MTDDAKPTPGVQHEAFDEYKVLFESLWEWYKKELSKPTKNTVRTARLMTAVLMDIAIMLAVDTELPEEKFISLVKENYQRRQREAPKWAE